jgi:hypothetical protein
MATRRRTKRAHRLRSKSKRRLRGGEGGAPNAPKRPTPEELERKKKEYIEMLTDWDILERVRSAKTPDELVSIMNTGLVPGCLNKYVYNSDRASFIGTKAVIAKKIDIHIDAMKDRIRATGSMEGIEAVLRQGLQALCKAIPTLGISTNNNVRNANTAQKEYNSSLLNGIEKNVSPRSRGSSAATASFNIPPPRANE